MSRLQVNQLMQQYNAAQRTPYLPTYNSVDRGMLNGFQRQSAEPDQSAPQPSFILPPVPKESRSMIGNADENGVQKIQSMTTIKNYKNKFSFKTFINGELQRSRKGPQVLRSQTLASKLSSANPQECNQCINKMAQIINILDEDIRVYESRVRTKENVEYMNRLIQLYNIAISVQQQRQYLTKSFVPFQSNQHIILQTQSPVLGSSQIGSLQNIVYLHKSNVQPTPVVPAPPIHIVPPYIQRPRVILRTNQHVFSNKELPSPQRVLPLSGSTFRAGSDTNLQHSRDINVLISETNELRILIQKLELEKSEMTVRIHHYETLLQSTGSQVQEATEGYKTEIALLRKQIAELKSMPVVLEGGTQAINTVTPTSPPSTSQQSHELRLTISKLTTTIEEYESRYRQAQITIKNLESSQVREREISSYQQQIKQLQAQIQTYKGLAIGDASAESKELITLRASLKRMDELVSSYETQLAEAENTINYYESLNVGQEIQQYKQKITTYQQQITIYEESIERYKKQIVELKKELTEMKESNEKEPVKPKGTSESGTPAKQLQNIVKGNEAANKASKRNEQFERLLLANKQLHSTIRDYQLELKESKSHFQFFQTTTNEKLQFFRDEVVKTNQRIQQLEIELAHERRNVQIGVSPLSDTSGIKRLTEKIKILEEELAELKAKPNERILVLEKELAEMTRLYDEKIIRIEEFEKEVEDRRQDQKESDEYALVRIEELEKEIVWLKKTHNEEIINKDTRIEQMDEEINKLIKIINQDREQSRGLEVEIARLKEELAGVRFAERSNETKERDREGQDRLKSQEEARFKAREDKLLSQIAGYQNRLKFFQEEIKRLNEAHTAEKKYYESTITSLKSEISQLKVKSEMSQLDEVYSVTSDNQHYENTIVSLKSEMKQLNESHTATTKYYESTIVSLKEEISQIRDTLTSDTNYYESTIVSLKKEREQLNEARMTDSKNYESTISTIEQENTRLKEKISQLSEKLFTLESPAKSLPLNSDTNLSSGLKFKRRESKSDINKYSELETLWKDEKSKLEETIVGLRSQLEETMQQDSQLNETIHSLRNELGNVLHSEERKSQDALDAANKEIAGLKSEFTALVMEKHSIYEQNTILRTNIVTLHSQLDQFVLREKESKETINFLRYELARVSQPQQNKSQDGLDQVRKEILALRAELAASQVEKNKLQDELALLRAKNIDAMSLLAQKEDKSPIKEISLQQVEDLKKKIDELHGFLEKAEDYIIELQKRLQSQPSVSTETPTSNDELERLLADNTKMEGVIAELNSRLSQYEKQMTTFSANTKLQITSFELKISQYQSQINALNVEINRLNSVIIVLNEQITVLHRQQSQAPDSEIKALVAERDRKIAELKEMEAKLVIAEDYIILQQNSLREGEAKLAEIIVFHDRAVEAVKKLEANLVQEKGKLAHAVEEKERMKEELRKYADAEAALQQMEASLRNQQSKLTQALKEKERLSEEIKILYDSQTIIRQLQFNLGQEQSKLAMVLEEKEKLSEQIKKYSDLQDAIRQLQSNLGREQSKLAQALQQKERLKDEIRRYEQSQSGTQSKESQSKLQQAYDNEKKQWYEQLVKAEDYIAYQMNLIESLQAELKADRLKIQSYESSSARESLEANQASLLIVELNDLKEIIMQRDQRIQQLSQQLSGCTEHMAKIASLQRESALLQDKAVKLLQAERNIITAELFIQEQQVQINYFKGLLQQQGSNEQLLALYEQLKEQKIEQDRKILFQREEYARLQSKKVEVDGYLRTAQEHIFKQQQQVRQLQNMLSHSEKYLQLDFEQVKKEIQSVKLHLGHVEEEIEVLEMRSRERVEESD